MTLRFSLEEKLAALLTGFAIVGGLVGLAGSNLIITGSGYVWTGWMMAFYGAMTLLGALGGGVALAKEILNETTHKSFASRIRLMEPAARVSEA